MSGPGPDESSESADNDRSSEPKGEPTAEAASGETPDRSESSDEGTATNGSGGTGPTEQAGSPAAESAGESPGSPDSPAPEHGSQASDHEPLEPREAPVRWFFRTDNSTVVAVRDVLSSVAIVALIGLVLFGISGIWPPMVAVESGSMEPNMERGDLIFIADEQRFVGDDPTGDTGVVTADTGVENGHEKFGQAGDVVVFRPEGSEFRTPVIHRVHFWVEPGENWVEEQADPDHLNGATTCEEVMACPASHAGFVTKGDANNGYDQANAGARTDVVRPAWIEGKAMFRIPWLGHVRLAFDELLATGPVGPAGPVESVAAEETTSNGPLEGASIGVGQIGAGLAGATAIGALTIVRRQARG